MLDQKKTYIGMAVAGIALIGAGSAAAYYATQGNKSESAIAQNNTASAPVAAAQPAPAPQQVVTCDDGNIVGLATGAVAGGVVGNQFGKGKGNTAATIGGAAGGAYLGQKYIPTDGVTCR